MPMSLIRSLLVISTLLASAASTAETLQDQVDAALSKHFAAAVQADGSRQESEWQKLDPRLKLPLCPQPLQVETISGQNSQRSTVRIHCLNPAWNMLVPVQVRKFRQVVVTGVPVLRNSVLSANTLRIEEREIKPAQAGAFTDTDAVAGRIARRPIAEGQVVTAGMLKAAEVVSKGQSVIIEAGNGGFAVRSSGTAMTNGGMGDTIKVRNAQSGRVVEGVVVSEGKVRVPL